MSLPTYTTVATALRNLALVANEDRTARGARQLFDAINKVAQLAETLAPATYAALRLPRELFIGVTTENHLTQVVMEDTDHADVAALLVAYTALDVGESFVLAQATADLTDNALETAKGSATAAGDVFMVITATTVLYLGTVAALVN